MAYSFFPNDFQNLPNLQDQLFLIKQKQAAELNEVFLGSERARAAYDARPMPKLDLSAEFIARIPQSTPPSTPAPTSDSKINIPPTKDKYYYPGKKETKPRDIAAEQEAIKKFMPSRPTGEESKPQPSLTSVRTAPSSPFKQPRPEGGFPKQEVIDQSKPSGSIAGGLGISPEAPTKPRRGVTKSGKMITITSDKRPESRYIDGSGMSNEYRDKDGNVHIAYGVRSGPPEGMSRDGEDYVDVGDDFDDKTSNPTEYYTTKSKQREANMASFKQSLSRGNREKPYIQ
jgi:hypothetical protein